VQLSSSRKTQLIECETKHCGKNGRYFINYNVTRESSPKVPWPDLKNGEGNITGKFVAQVKREEAEL
jgi:hypothetical protein